MTVSHIRHASPVASAAGVGTKARTRRGEDVRRVLETAWTGKPAQRLALVAVDAPERWRSAPGHDPTRAAAATLACDQGAVGELQGAGASRLRTELGDAR